ncbi:MULTISPECIES: TetR/AcrR family transcriptional regulator [unclassified Variovorax]|uniref:TetR/AcrR family transcriptional regulator n=1 Tax=unclassified Variovorax TaxID=663243 RepID=UPI001BD4CBF0|nr:MULTISPECIES: TetR/AcrR family transcriptional regulator [unclassified Variovorax]
MTITLLDPVTELSPSAEAVEPKRRARGRPSVVQAAELREAFLDAATQSFLEKGYAGTSIEAVARDAGVAKITIYRQFENKQALFHEVIHRAVEKARTDMHAALKGEQTNTEERLLELIEGMYLGATEPRTLGLLRLVIAEATRFPELAKLVYTENSWVLGPVVAYLEEAHRNGQLHVPNPELTAVQLSNLAFGGVRFFISRPLGGPVERREWAQGVLDLVLGGLAPRKASQEPEASHAQRSEGSTV